jgi:hypothetical protein
MGRKQSSSPFWRSRSPRSASAPATPRGGAAEPPLGCMSMVQYLIFAPGAGCVGRPPSSSSSSNPAAAIVEPNYDRRSDVEAAVHKHKEKRGGFDAPRNSLDLDADNLNDILQVGLLLVLGYIYVVACNCRHPPVRPSIIHVALLAHQTHQFITCSSNKSKQIGVQIEPVFDALACRKMRPPSCGNKPAAAASPSEAETPRTPGLVARLMGIDGLPDEKPSPSLPASPRKENNSKQSPNAAAAAAARKKKKSRAPLRSLSCNVETPPRTSWDGPLKENSRLDGAAPRPYTSLPTSPVSAVVNSNKKSSKRRATAKEIVRQAKETVAARRAKQQQQHATDNKENVSPGAVPPVRKDKLLAVGTGNQAQASAKPVPSPREPRALGPRREAPKHPPPPPPPPPLHTTTTPPTVTRARKPDGCERFATRIKKPSAPTPPRRAAPPARTSEDPEYAYIRTVLERGGFMRAPTRRSSSSLASPAIDPIVFHLLELELPAADDGPLRHRWNRKLMFHLAQEILADLILLDLEDDSSSARLAATGGGAPLLARVWKKVQSFPAANCRVVGDIDALVATDLEPAQVPRHPADVAEELAERVLEDLVGEECLSLSACS